MRIITAVRKQIRSTIVFALSFLLLFSINSCEKVIDIDLENVEKKYVIEGNLTDQLGHAKVQISTTKDFKEDNNFPPVSGAVVTISEVGGAVTLLTETSAGVYEAPSLRGTSGKQYKLLVRIGSEEFGAESILPQRVNLDTIFVTDEILFTETRKIANAVFQDPAGRGNSYRFIQYVNGIKEEQLLIMNDEYTDGRNITSTLYYFSDDDDDDDDGSIKTGDEVRIEMQCIDQAMYKYWFSLFRSSTGGSGQATPANPVSNMQGGALGYFSAHTYQQKQMIVP
jgi:hypothetical protein